MPCGLRATSLLAAALCFLAVGRPVTRADEPKPPPALTAAQRARLQERDRLAAEVRKLRQAGKLSEAIAAMEKMLAIEREVFGPLHEEVVGSLEQLANLYRDKDDLTAARKARQEVLRIQTQRHGADNWRVGDAQWDLRDLERWIGWDAQSRKQYREAQKLNAQAAELWNKGQYQEALPLAQHCRQLTKQLQTENHPDYASSLNTLALLYHVTGDYAKALPLYERARDLCKTLRTENHPEYATSVSNLAMLYQHMGDYAQALPLLEQARDLKKKLLTEHSPEYATSLDNLGTLYHDMGDSAKALPLLEQARDLYKQLLTENHPDYATSISNLAMVYEALGDSAKALPLLEQARDLKRKVLTENHPAFATSLHNLATLYHDMGDYARALPLCEHACDLDKQLLTENHHDYATGLNNLALLYKDMGDYGKAEPVLRQALAITQRNLELASTTQSERAQLAMSRQRRGILDNYLEVNRQGHLSPGPAYAALLTWKGAVFQRQRRLRLAHECPELSGRFTELDTISRRLATLALSVPPPQQQAAYRRQLTELSAQKEQLEQTLAAQSATFRQELQRAKLAPAQVQALLPKDTALVDFLEYHTLPPTPKGKKRQPEERRFEAFVLRPDCLERVELGPAEPIAAAVDAWLALLTGTPAARAGNDPAATLRRLLWLPLEKHLQGVKTVLLSPDGALGRLPWAALPGSQPDHYLIEDLTLAVLPVPQLLPELMASGPNRAGHEPALLLVGDVDYGAAPGSSVAQLDRRSAARGSRPGALKAFEPLPGTRHEVLAVRDSFERRFPGRPVHLLREGQATEEALRQQGPQHSYLHLATHGFFAPPEVRSALAPARAGPGADNEPFGGQGVVGFHPGLLSGIALAGANEPYRENQDDGILTALEVAGLDLRKVDLAVLSACETGLGQVAAGEGLLGLQRAFQMAGARSVVASLWQVDDTSTRDLMVRFYENLWDRSKPRSTVEALRQAQLWMLREGAKRGPGAKNAGDPQKLAAARPAEKRTPPYFWAGFVLSGDWR
jgi:CHAT domain-containing protein/tetratricopeptide (TPR) repeat protein